MKINITLLSVFLFLSAASHSQITLTFTVDVSGLYIGPGGMHIAGEFMTTGCTSILDQWQPAAPGSQMTLVSGATYTIDVVFPATSAGDSLQFEFVRDNVWGNGYGDMSEGNPGDTSVFLNDSCGIDDQVGGLNRLILIPDCGGTYACTWNHCAFVDPAPCDTLGFSCSNTNLCEKFCVDFTDQSTNNPTSWEWHFPGGSPSTSTEQNPTNICYSVPGIYDVTLISFSSNGIDSITLPYYITVNATPASPTITQTGYLLTSSPASSYQWQFNTVDVAGATNQSYQVMQTGYYSVLINDSNGCANLATVYIQITGIGDPCSGFIVSVVPNPILESAIISLQLPGEENISAIIYDITGKVVQNFFHETMIEGSPQWEWNTTDKNGNKVNAGIYLLTIETPKSRLTFKLCVIR